MLAQRASLFRRSQSGGADPALLPPDMSKLRPRQPQVRAIYAACGALALLLVIGALRRTAPAAAASGSLVYPWHLSQTGGVPATLVLYIFSNTDPEYIRNLEYFARFGAKENDGCEYIFIIQKDKDKETPALPVLPSNARYVEHENRCFDWGTVGWALAEKHFDPDRYAYFIILNSSVRGPFLPSWAAGKVTWQDALLSQLSDSVRLVGPTVSCEGSPFQGDVTGEWRANPHVQSYVVATDRAGFAIWQEDAKVFGCYDSMWDVIWHGELGSSLAVLAKGFNIAALMERYRGVDWRDKANWECNAKANPYGEDYLDGISLSPHEVMFVKVKEKALQNDWIFARQAVKYAQYDLDRLEQRTNVNANEYRANPRKFRLQKLGYLYKRGPQCFDLDYYAEKNPDLAGIPRDDLWGHFLRGGAFEGRSFRFTCPATDTIPQP